MGQCKVNLNDVVESAMEVCNIILGALSISYFNTRVELIMETIELFRCVRRATKQLLYMLHTYGYIIENYANETAIYTFVEQ